MDRHHTEYQRRVRVQRHQRDKKRKHAMRPARQSERPTAQTKEVDMLKAAVLEREAKIDVLASALDAQEPVQTSDQGQQTEDDVLSMFLI